MTGKKFNKVLIVDDNEIDLFINKKVIEYSQFAAEITVLQSGSRAVDFLKEAKGEEIPDVLFLDLNMPLVDGFHFLVEFSKMSTEIRSKLKIIVLTSSDNLRDKEKIGANPDVKLFLSKPLNEDKLNEVINSLG